MPLQKVSDSGANYGLMFIRLNYKSYAKSYKGFEYNSIIIPCGTAIAYL